MSKNAFKKSNYDQSFEILLGILKMTDTAFPPNPIALTNIVLIL